MAPTKKDAEKGEKEAKLTPEQSSSLIIDYLHKQNRPYSAIDISSNLKNRVSKAAAQKLLKDLHERNQIAGQAAGKQIVYHAIQHEADEMTMEKLQEMDAETSRLKERTVALRTEEKELRQSLREGAALVPLSELRQSLELLQEQEAEMDARLARLTAGDVKPVSVQDRAATDQEHRKWTRIALARKKIRSEMWQEISSAIEKDQVADLQAELGLEF